MANTKTGPIVSFPAAAALDTKAGYFGVRDSSGNIAVAGAGVAALGLIMDSTPAADAAGLQVDVQIQGLGYAICDGSVTAVAAGDPLKTNASGKGVFATIGTDQVVAVALGATTASAGSVLVRLI